MGTVRSMNRRRPLATAGRGEEGEVGWEGSELGGRYGCDARPAATRSRPPSVSLGWSE